MENLTVGILSAVPRLRDTLRIKMPFLNFINIEHNVSETVKQNDIKILIADSDLLSEVMYDIPNINWVQGTWAGFDKVFAKYDPGRPLPFVITRNAGPHLGAMMSEYVITNLVALFRDFHLSWKMQEQQIWHRVDKVFDYTALKDFRFCILGAGIIGRHIASVLKNLGVSQIWATVHENRNEKLPYIDELRTNSDIGEVLGNSDVIINILPGTELTKGLLNVGNLCNCKNAIFVNVGRGTVISEADIIESINKNYLSAAILDVFPDEPLRKDSPLWRMKQVVITPHVAAMPRARDISELFSKNFAHWISKEPFPNVLDLARQY